MRFKKWEKWYWGIALVVWIGLTIWISTWDRGLAGTLNGEPHVFSKTSSFFIILLPAFIFPLWIWFLLRFWFLRTNDFICKYCRKEFSGRMETEKEVCRDCHEKKKKTLIKEYPEW